MPNKKPSDSSLPGQPIEPGDEEPGRIPLTDPPTDPTKRSRSPVEPIGPVLADDIHTYTVMLERPTSEELADYDRAEKYRLLKGMSVESAEALRTWIDENGLSGDVQKIGNPTTFSVLFVTGTERLGEELANAPGVQSVVPSEEFKVDLPAPVDRFSEEELNDDIE